MICTVIGKGAFTRCNAKFATRKLICPSAVRIVAGNSVVCTVCQRTMLAQEFNMPALNDKIKLCGPKLTILTSIVTILGNNHSNAKNTLRQAPRRFDTCLLQRHLSLLLAFPLDYTQTISEASDSHGHSH